MKRARRPGDSPSSFREKGKNAISWKGQTFTIDRGVSVLKYQSRQKTDIRLLGGKEESFLGLRGSDGHRCTRKLGGEGLFIRVGGGTVLHSNYNVLFRFLHGLDVVKGEGGQSRAEEDMKEISKKKIQIRSGTFCSGRSGG